MQFRAPRIRTASSFRLVLLAFSIGCTSLFAQAGRTDSGFFDIRNYDALLAQTGAAPKTPARVKAAAGVEAALESFRGVDGRPADFTLSRFGLPRRLSTHGSALSASGPGAPADRALAFLRAHPGVFPFTREEIDGLRLAREETAGNLRIVRFDQTLGGSRVYRARLSVAVDLAGRVIQVSAGDALPGLRPGPAPVLDAAAAQAKALESVAKETANLEALLTEPVVFPLGSGEGRHAWRVFVDGPANRWEVVVDAVDGRTLLRAGLAQRAASANVFTTRPPAPREVVEFPAGWLPAAGTLTRGNNIDAHLDIDADGVPDPVTADGLVEGRAASDDSQFFDHPAGDGYTADPQYLAAAVTNAFYFGNIAHDYFYEMGFQEADGAYQLTDFMSGGKAGDPVEIGVQDLSVLDNASFLPAPDGMSSRMRLGVLLREEGVLDLAFDGDSVLHEYAHGVSTRLVGGPDEVSCLSFEMQAAAMGEALSDYYAASYFDDPVLFEYGADNPAVAARRSPLNNSPHRFENMGMPYFEPHSDGEILSAVLWKIREGIGKEAADELILQALKMLPCDPTFLDLRDAMLTIDETFNRGRNQAMLWGAFAEKGMGYSARAANFAGDGKNTLFDSAADLPPSLAPNANRPPRFLGFPSDPAVAGEPFQYTARVEDPDGDSVTLRLLEGPEGATFDAASGRLSYRGTFTSPRISIEATDSKGARTVHGLQIFSFAILTQGRPLAISGSAYSRGVGAMIIDGRRDALQITLRGGTGDADLEVLPPIGPFIASAEIGSSETVTIENPLFPAIWLFRVDGITAYNNVTMTADFPRITSFEIGSQRPPLNGAQSSETLFKITVPAGTPHLRVTARGGTGDADLLLARGFIPYCEHIFGLQFCDYDFDTVAEGNLDVIEVPSPMAGEWFLTVKGFRDFRNVELSTSVTPSKLSLSGATDAAAFGELLPSGGIGTLFGTDFTSETVSASSLPLPTSLGGVQVFIDGEPAGLFFASPTQINFQVPVAAGLGRVDVVATTAAEVSQRLTAVVAAQVPEAFTFPYADGELAAVVTHANGSVVTPDNPALPGEVLVAYLNGAAIDPQPADGEPALADPLSLTKEPALVTVGGVEAETLFSGATPAFVGLIQVNFRMPEALPAGGVLELGIAFGEQSTTPRALAVAP